MARYTDVDALLSKLPDDLPYKGSVKRVLMQAPTADVAPKSEVAREIFWEVDKLLSSIVSCDEDGTEFIGIDVQKYYELKKKYTEGQK